MVHYTIQKWADKIEAGRPKDRKRKPEYEGKEMWWGRFNERFMF